MTFIDLSRAGPHACLGSLSWTGHHIFWQRFANTTVPSLLPKDRGEVSAQGPGTFELYAGLGVEREKEVKSGSRKSPSPYIVESSQGRVLGEANSNGLRDLWKGLPQHLSFHLKAKQSGGLCDLEQGHTSPRPSFASGLNNEGLFGQQVGREGSLLSPPFPVLPPQFPWPACLGL